MKPTPLKPQTASPALGFRARLEEHIAGANSAVVVKQRRKGSDAKAKLFSKAARTSIDEMKEWYKTTLAPGKESERAIPIPGFTRHRRLGRGGFGEVWDVCDEASGRCYALKHIRAAHSSSAISEIRAGASLFPRVRLDVDASTLQLVTHTVSSSTSSDAAEISHSSNSSNAEARVPFTELYRVLQESRDFWLLYERGGRTLHELLFAIRGEFHNGSRVYRLEHKALYQQMRAEPAIVKSLLRQLLEAVQMLSDRQIVHADIKPDNILLQWRASSAPGSHPSRQSAANGTAAAAEVHASRAPKLCVQLIDFGSAFTTDKGRYPLTPSSEHGGRGGGGGTPEYVPPEALVPPPPPPPPPLLRPQSSSSSSSLRAASATKDASASASRTAHASSFDVWSVGAVLLELLCGFPLWFGYRSRVELDGKEHWMKTGGLFTTKHRDPASIHQRQLQVVADIERAMQSYPAGVVHDWDAQTAEAALDLLARLLDPSPKTRVAPDAALSHPFLAQAEDAPVTESQNALTCQRLATESASH